MPATYRYTCCQASDIERPWHPGDLFVLHWISEALPMTEARPPTPVMLTAELAGPFKTVDRLKTATTAAPFAQATSARTTTHGGKALTSTILIPADAAPGLYRLNFAIDSAGEILSGSSVIEIVRVKP
ncbi:MAG TPA: hypothetical protein VLC50_06495 [Actinomycetes bacterium]|nr:hypothetical protein [Actinomycetes bacterium]